LKPKRENKMELKSDKINKVMLLLNLESCGQVGVCWGFISDHRQMKVAEQSRGDLKIKNK
jgi:hypothetical protein